MKWCKKVDFAQRHNPPVTIARLRGMSILYYDLWAEYSDMEVRNEQQTPCIRYKPRLHLSPTSVSYPN